MLIVNISLFRVATRPAIMARKAGVEEVICMFFRTSTVGLMELTLLMIALDEVKI